MHLAVVGTLRSLYAATPRKPPTGSAQLLLRHSSLPLDRRLRSFSGGTPLVPPPMPSPSPLRPLAGRDVLVTGLLGGVGAQLAKQLLLLGAAVAVHHPEEEDVVTADTLDASGGLLRPADLGDGLAAAVGRRLRAWVGAEGAAYGGGVGSAGRVEVLAAEALEGMTGERGADCTMHRDAVVACDGAGPLSVGPGMASPDCLVIVHLHTTTAAAVALLVAAVQGLARCPLIVGSQCTRTPLSGARPRRPAWCRRPGPDAASPFQRKPSQLWYSQPWFRPWKHSRHPHLVRCLPRRGSSEGSTGRGS